MSPLTIANGGAAGLADVRHIASVVGTSPIRTAHAASTMTDERAANLVEHDLHSGRRVAPGFGNASIEPQRYTRGPMREIRQQWRRRSYPDVSVKLRLEARTFMSRASNVITIST